MSRMWWYTLGVVTVWVINPELRRVYGYYFGFTKVEVLGLVPLLSLIPHLWSLTFGGGWRRLPPLLSCAAWIWVGAFVYGLVIAALSGNIASGSYDFIGFVLPIGVGLWVAADEAEFSVAYQRLKRTFFGLASIISVYGIIQYVVAPAWDVAWLNSLIQQLGSTTFGLPAPFLIRVFSTLNSPAGFGSFLALVLILALPELSVRRPWLLVQVPIWFVAFSLSLVRTGWLMFAFGALVYVALTPRRNKVLGALTLAAVIVLGIMTLLPTAIGGGEMLTSLSNRFATLSNLDEDGSQQARSGIYQSAPEQIGASPFGQGLGIVGTSTKLSAKGAATDFDSGILARAVEMGVPGVVLYAIPLILFLFAALGLWKQARIARDESLQLFASAAIGLNIALAFEQLSLDLGGLLVLTLWLISGLAVRARIRRPRPGFRLALA